jgi:hypothetical protein
MRAAGGINKLPSSGQVFHLPAPVTHQPAKPWFQTLPRLRTDSNFPEFFKEPRPSLMMLPKIGKK